MEQVFRRQPDEAALVKRAHDARHDHMRGVFVFAALDVRHDAGIEPGRFFEGVLAESRQAPCFLNRHSHHRIVDLSAKCNLNPPYSVNTS